MKILKNIGIGLGVLILLLVIVSFFLPSTAHVERSIEMNCAPDVPFALVNNLKNWDQWSPWHHRDSLMKKTYGEVFEGKGATYSWESKVSDVGTGHINFIDVTPNEHIKSEMFFMKNDKPAIGEYKFEKTEKGCKMIWSMDADMSSPFVIGKYFGLMMDGFVGKDFEAGLAKIKQVSESTPPPATGRVAGIEEITVPAMNCMMTEGECDMKDISATLGMLFGKIGKEMMANGAKQAGAVCAMYPGYKDGDTHTKITACVPCSKQCDKCSEGLKCSKMPATKAVVAHYFGPYDKTNIAYTQLKDWMATNKKEAAGEPWEEYANDPMTEKDPAKYQTNVYFPIK